MKKSILIILKLILSITVSAFLLGLLLNLFTGSADAAVRPQLLTVLRQTSLVFVALYFIFALIQAFFRAVRYRLLIRAGGEVAPSLFHTYLVTLTRNMLVDMLPARLGELSYIGMMNRGYKVSGKICVSSMGISFVFDFIALLLVVAGIIGFQIVTLELQPWLLNVLTVLVIVVSILIGALFYGIHPIVRQTKRILGKFAEKKLFRTVLGFVEDVATAVDNTREAGIFGKILGLSVIVRLTKYIGLYFIFLAVAKPNFPELAGASFGGVLCSLLGAEGAASLPLPTFMSFGTYEAGGILTLTMLGFSVAGSEIAMLSLHIWSQFADYLLGGAGLIIFIFLTGKSVSRKAKETSRYRYPGYILFFCTIVTLFAGMVFFGMQYRKTKKLGAMTPPPAGYAVAEPGGNDENSDLKQKSIKGFVVWSSARYGNHDILKMSLPDKIITRLTANSHVDTYPRISPDGTMIVFCRSRQEWVSQRNPVPWDTWLLDLKTGKKRMLAEFAFTPAWTADGKYVVFVRNGEKVVQIDIRSREEVVLCESGKEGIPKGIIFQTPSYNQKLRAVAVTMRGAKRETAVIRNGKIFSVGGGCELVWVPDKSDAILCYIDHKGHDNIIYGYNFDTEKRDIWVNLSGSLSHEYFPEASNDGKYLVFGASSGGRGQHEHDTADYEIFLWKRGLSGTAAIRLTHHTGNDCWPDIFVD